MPNINEFKAQCLALGLDHIEVDPEYDDSEYFKENGNWKTFTVQSLVSYVRSTPIETISMETYEHYENLFKQTDIVFFMLGERDGVVFIGNGLIFSERGGGTETWTYDTHTVELEMKGGIRVFNEVVKDELVAQRILGITAESLCDKDSNGKYKATSLYGKVQAKTNQLMKDAGKWDNLTNKGDLAGVKLPWFYSTYVFDPLGAFYGENYDGVMPDDLRYLYPHEDFGHKVDVYNNSNVGFALPLSVQLSSINNNKYYYKFYTQVGSGVTGFEFTAMSVYDTNESPKNSPRENTINSIIQNNYSKVALSVGDSVSGSRGIFYAAWSKRSNSGYGGINNPDIVRPSAGATSQWSDLTVAYKEQPFLIGMVYWITMYGTDDSNYPMLNGYITSIAFNQYGEILEPICPYWDGSDRITITDDTDPEIQEGGSKSNYEPLPSVGYANLNGKTLIPMAIPITSAEDNYAQNLNYIVVPTNWIPEGYIDDEL